MPPEDQDTTSADNTDVIPDSPSPDSQVTQTVPVTVVQTIRSELKGLKAQNALLQEQIELYKANAANARTVTAPGGNTTVAPQEIDDPLANLADDDVVSAADLKKFRTSILAESNRLQQTIQGLTGSISEMSIMSQYPDYKETITKKLPIALKDNPQLAQVISSSANPHMVAYFIARNMSAPVTETGTTADKDLADQGNDIDRIIANALKPKTATKDKGVAGSVGAGSLFANMTDEQFEAHIQTVKRNTK